MTTKWNIRRLEENDERANFDCDEQSLNDYFRQRALGFQNRNGSVTWVLIANEEIAGYYTAAFSSLTREEAPKLAARATKPYSVPAFLIARLAVHNDAKKQGFGRKLLCHALLNAIECSKAAGLTLVAYSHRFWPANRIKLAG